MASAREKEVYIKSAGGAFATVVFYVIGVWVDPFNIPKGLDFASRAVLFFPWLLCLAIPLFIAIMRVMGYRMFVKNSTDAQLYSSTETDVNLLALKSQLINTQEQTLLALLLYCVWLALAPSENISALCLSAVAFFVGRLFFFIGYDYNAVLQSLGFVLTFIPQVLLLLHGIIFFVIGPCLFA